MAGGRTSWLPRDAAHHDRELVVELGEEFGPVGPYLDTLLRDLAQQQRSDGHVLTGFRSLARKGFTTTETVRQIVEHGHEIGLFDDLVFHEDGRRFELWCSGWEADAQLAFDAKRYERGRVTASVRRRILDRDGHHCQHCTSRKELQIDHIKPIALGGLSDDDNLQVLCGPCNRAKGAR